MYAATTPVNRVKPAINFIRVQHETWPTPKRRVGLVASVYICQGDRWLTIRDNGNITGHWRVVTEFVNTKLEMVLKCTKRVCLSYSAVLHCAFSNSNRDLLYLKVFLVGGEVIFSIESSDHKVSIKYYNTFKRMLEIRMMLFIYIRFPLVS